MLRRWPLLLLALSFVAIPGLLTAQEEVPRQWVSVDFPHSLTFRVEASASEEITQAVVRFQVEERSCAQVESTGYPEITPGRQVSTQWVWDMRKTGGLPPGATARYRWEFTDASGNVRVTPASTVEIVDQRHPWRTIAGDDITLNWYRGDEEFATALGEAAREALVRLEAFTGARPEKPVKLYIYGSTQDLQEALVYPQEWTDGVSFNSFDIVAIGIEPGSLAWGWQAIAHELAHVVIGQVAHNCYTDLPTWLNEGLATHNEGDASPTYAASLEQAVKDGRFFSIRSISGSFPTAGRDATLAYGESRSVVEYLVLTFGSEKLDELLATFRSGSAADAALQRVYGFDQAGLQERWRISLGAAPFPDSVPETPQDPQVPVLPTFAPFSFATPPPVVATAVPSPSLTPTQPPSGGGLNCSPGPLAASVGTPPDAAMVLFPA